MLKTQDLVKVLRPLFAFQRLDSPEFGRFCFQKIKCILALYCYCHPLKQSGHQADSTTVLCNLVYCQVHSQCYGNPIHHFLRFLCYLHFVWLIRKGVCQHSVVVLSGLCFRRPHHASKRMVFQIHFSSLNYWYFPHLVRKHWTSLQSVSVTVEYSQLSSYEVQVI